MSTVQGWAKRQSPGLGNFVTAVAYHLCLALLAAFTQPGDHFSDKLCTHKAFIFSSRNVVVAAFEARAWTYSCEAANSRCMRAALEGETGATQMSEAQCKLECKQEGGRSCRAERNHMQSKLP